MEQFDLTKKFIADKNAKLAMIYKEKERTINNLKRRELEEQMQQQNENADVDDEEEIDE